MSAEVPANSEAAFDQVGDVLEMMFKGWGVFGAGASEIQAKTILYAGAVRDLPVWAVQEAVFRWRDGRWTPPFGESFAKIPSPATLKAMAEQEVENARNMLSALERVDAAVAEVPRIPPSPEERERIGAKFAQLSKEMGERMAARAQAEKDAYAPTRALFDAHYKRLREERDRQTVPQENAADGA